MANAVVVTVAGVTEELAEAEAAGGRPPDRRRGQSQGTGLTPGTGWTKHSSCPHTPFTPKQPNIYIFQLNEL